MKTRFADPTDITEKVAEVRITQYRSRPYVNSKREYVEDVVSTEIKDVQLTPDVLSYDTIMWTGYNISLTKLSDMVRRRFGIYGYSGITLLNIK